MAVIDGPATTVLAHHAQSRAEIGLRKRFGVLVAVLLAGYATFTASAQSQLRPGNEAEVIQRVQEGGLIQLMPGVYNFSEGWQLSNDVEILGADPTSTILMFSSSVPGGWYAIDWVGSGVMRLADVTITFAEPGNDAERRGTNVIHVASGSAELTNIVVQGAVSSVVDGVAYNGQGLRVDGTGSAHVQSSVFQGNEYHGVAVAGNAKVVFDGNQVRDSDVGFGIWDSAAGVLTSNEFTECRYTGVSVSGDGQVTIDGNNASYNSGDGIRIWRAARPTVTNNTVTRNGGVGIEIWDRAQPLITSNVITENYVGIAVSDEAAGTISDNNVSLNAWEGLQVSGAAKPLVEHNRINENQADGVALSDYAAGTYRNNNIELNAFIGLVIADGARPTIEANSVLRNSHGGIEVRDFAGGWISRNIIDQNGGDGIACWGTADSSIRDNTIRNNAGVGYFSISALCRESGSTFQNNQDGDRLE